jgi:tRNA G18 (ribose-2'-O)-methylase SpoU
MARGIDSLNVAAAGAILMHRLTGPVQNPTA